MNKSTGGENNQFVNFHFSMFICKEIKSSRNFVQIKLIVQFSTHLTIIYVNNSNYLTIIYINNSNYLTIIYIKIVII